MCRPKRRAIIIMIILIITRSYHLASMYFDIAVDVILGLNLGITQGIFSCIKTFSRSRERNTRLQGRMVKHLQRDQVIFHESLDFLQPFMNDTNLIDSCQAHLPMKRTSNINSFARSDTGVVIDSEPHLSRTCKANLLFAPLVVCV